LNELFKDALKTYEIIVAFEKEYKIPDAKLFLGG
jgi:hypothetical protein